MQALTPLLFSMLFPRSNSNKVTVDPEIDGDSEYPHSALLGFQDGYSLHNNNQQPVSAKARRHHSMGAASTGPRRSRTALGETDEPVHSNINRSSTFPPASRTSTGRRRPQRLSLDHAAFIATYPSLDGLGDMGPRPATTSSLHKKRSPETLPSSRNSTSSISSMVSDASTASSSSSSSSVREPLTPTRSPNYRSTLKSKTATRTAATTKDLISLQSYEEDEGQVCLSPRSNNDENLSLSAAEALSGNIATGYKPAVAEARGQRQLIAH
ncbi:unnamed protein product [Mortierella alpina]